MTYGEYLRVPDLLGLQQLQSGSEHDELLFITIHQVYELWFQQVLHELDRLVERLAADDVARARHTVQRVRTIIKTMVAQLDVLETMTPLEFLSFRDFLGSSSGFESLQFRELEFLLGQKQRVHLDRFADTPGFDRLVGRWESPTVWDAVLGLVDRSGRALPDEVLRRDVTAPTASHPAVQDALVSVLREDAGSAGLLEGLTDVDEGLQEWRYRHVMMVLRTIGTKPGTGGSSGVGYLQGTLFRPVFPDLWEIRGRL
jgi:tryptophan 2,3-dioxygenase